MQYLKEAQVKGKKFFSIEEVFNIGDVLFSKLCNKYSRKYGFSALPVRTNCYILNVVDDLMFSDEDCSNVPELEELVFQRDVFKRLFPSFNDYVCFYCEEKSQEFFLISPGMDLSSLYFELPKKVSMAGLCSLDNMGMPVMLISNNQLEKKLQEQV
ncbi:MAG: hypothetical protein JW791_05135 [Nanoarchaeota archaeon]|nr:hypothetical protein [Nanoarchaeota archaeon]